MPKNAKRWSADQRKFMLWLATSEIDRTPIRQGQLAKDMGHAEATLSDWKNMPGFIDEVNKLVDEHLGDDYAEIMDAFKREAKKGSFNHQKMYMEMMGKYTSRQQIEVSGGPIAITEIRVHLDTSDSTTK